MIRPSLASMRQLANGRLLRTGSLVTVVVTAMLVVSSQPTWAGVVLTGDGVLPDIIGMTGAGTLSISSGTAGSFVYPSSTVMIGFSTGSDGEVYVSGAGTVWEASGAHNIAWNGKGFMEVSGGATVTTALNGMVGMNASAEGHAKITGTNSRWEITNETKVGDFATSVGTLEILAGGGVQSGLAVSIGDDDLSMGTVTVDGSGSKWDTNNEIRIGKGGGGVLNITDGGMVVTGGEAVIGMESTGNGTVTVSGSNSSWANAAELQIGNETTGALTISSGGLVTNVGNASIGTQIGSSGSVAVTDTGSTWNNLADLAVGGSDTAAGGTGSLQIGTGATVSATGSLRVWPSGTMSLSGGVANAGALLNLGGTMTFSSGTMNLTSTGSDLGTSVIFGDGGLTDSVLRLAPGSDATVGDLYLESNVTLHLDGGSLAADTLNATVGSIRWDSGELRLGGGTSQIPTGISVPDFGTLAGTGTITGNVSGAAQSTISVGNGLLSLGDLTKFQGFNHLGTLEVGTGFLQAFSAGYAQLGSMTTMDTGGILIAPNGVAFGNGDDFQGSGDIIGAVAQAFGSEIQATGTLAMGESTAVNGFFGGGTLDANDQTVTLRDANDVVFDSGALVDLGSSGSGSLSAANGLTLDFGANMNGAGTVTTPNDATKPFVNNGHIQGASAGNPITLTGWVKGAGTMDNVNITGTDAPGFSPATVDRGSVAYNGTVEMELEGSSDGSYDQINHTLGTGEATLGGTLNVVPIGSYTGPVNPGGADDFVLMTSATQNGTFDTVQYDGSTLVPLGEVDSSGSFRSYSGTGGIFSALTYTATTVEFQNLLALPGDTDGDQDIDLSDYVRLASNFAPDGTTYTWTDGDFDLDGDIDLSDYNDLAANFAPTGYGSTNAVPEPSTLGLLSAGLFLMFGRRRRSSSSSIHAGIVQENQPMDQTQSSSANPKKRFFTMSSLLTILFVTATLLACSHSTWADELTGGVLMGDGSLPNIIGDFGSGTLTITAGAAGSCIYPSGQVFIGRTSSGNGKAFIPATGLVWEVANHHNIGWDGTGYMEISGGGKVASALNGMLAVNGGSNGHVVVTGIDSRWEINNETKVADRNTAVATLDILAGGTVQSGLTAYLGDDKGSTGTATVDGAGSLWDTNFRLRVGNKGVGILNVTNGGRITTENDGVVGWLATGNGTVTVDGVSSSWEIDGEFQVGDRADGVVTVSGGALISNVGNGSVGKRKGSSGVVTVGGSGSTWTNVADLGIAGSDTADGGNATGSLQVNSGGTVNVGGSLRVWTGGVLSLSGGAVNTAALLNQGGTMSFGSGTVNVTSTGSNLGSAATFGDGSASDSVLRLGYGSEATVNNLTLASNGKLHLDGGSLTAATVNASAGEIRWDGGDLHLTGGSSTVPTGLSIPNFGTLAGTGTVNGKVNGAAQSTISVGTGLFTLGDASDAQGFNHQGLLEVGTGFLQVNSAGAVELGSMTTMGVGGFLIAANGVKFGTGANFQGAGDVTGPVTQDPGSVIEATGNLAMGDSSSADGFSGNGILNANDRTITLRDANDAVFDSGAWVNLGSSGSGSVVANNGLTVDFGANINGTGTMTTLNDASKPLTNNGHIHGASVGSPITLSGWVEGVGTMDNVTITGTDSPGLSVASISRGSVTYNGTVRLEIEGASAGSYDQIHHILGAGTATLGGTLNVVPSGSYTGPTNPGDADDFVLMTAMTQNGTFGTVQYDGSALVPLGAVDPNGSFRSYSGTGGIFSAVTYTANSVEFQNLLAKPGDTDGDMDIDLSDYTSLATNFAPGGTTYMWTDGDFDSDGDIDLSDYNALASGFAPGGYGSTSAVPEPMSIVLAILGLVAVMVTGLRRNGR